MGVLSNGAIYIAPPLRSEHENEDEDEYENEDEDDKIFARKSAFICAICGLPSR
jgi:hypothetical protein